MPITTLSPDQIRVSDTRTLTDHLDNIDNESSGFYEDTAAGLLNTSDGEFFKVPEGGGDRLYYNNAGVAEDQSLLYPSKAVVDQSVIDAAANVVIASGRRIEAESARDEAVAAALVSGVQYRYNTYALANSDKGNIPLNSIVDVLVDETRNDRRVKYEVTTGPVLSFRSNSDVSGWEDFDYLPDDPVDVNRRIAVESGFIPRASPSLELKFGDTAPRHTVGGKEVDLSDLITYTGVPNRTHFNAQGKLVGVDFTTGSFVNNTDVGRNVFNTVLADDLLQITLDSDADNHRDWVVSKKVRLSQESNGANYVNGTVESYSASTQVLIVRVTATGVGAVNPALLKLSNLEIRDATYNPSTGERLGLLVEPAATNAFTDSRASSALIQGTDATSTSNSGVSFSGNNDFILYTPGVGNSYSRVRRIGSTGTTAAITVTGYVEVLRGGAQWAIILLASDGGGSGYGIKYEWATETVVTFGSKYISHEIRRVDDKIQVWVTATSDARADLSLYVVGANTNAPTHLNHTTDGTETFGFQNFGLYLNESGRPTPVPTRTVAATRAADVTVPTKLPFSTTGATIYIDFTKSLGSGQNHFFALQNSAGGTRQLIQQFNDGFRMYSGGTLMGTFGNARGIRAGRQRLIFQVSGAIMKGAYYDAEAGVFESLSRTDGLGGVAHVSYLQIPNVATYPRNIQLHDIRIFPPTLTDEEMETIVRTGF